MKANHTKIQIAVVEADALKIEADVLVLKYAQAFFGVDEVVAECFKAQGGDISTLQVANGSANLVEPIGVVAADRILFLGVEWLWQFGYREIRNFARRALLELQQSMPMVRHCALTLHGANYGLDEIEAFEAEIAGLIDAINAGAYPKGLERVSIVERNQRRAERLIRSLSKLLPKGQVETDTNAYFREIEQEASDRLRAAGYASDAKPHIFVAMPFKKEMDDVYEYGIQGAVRAAGYVCERADLSSFTGDVMSWVKKRIRTATLVVADLTDASPNVYLEVGYAWGVGIPTVLVIKDPSELKFDVQSQRCIPYERIKDLEVALTDELTKLNNNGSIEQKDEL